MTRPFWDPDTERAREAAYRIPEEWREEYRPIYVRGGEFGAMHCKHCAWEYGTGHFRDCPIFGKEAG